MIVLVITIIVIIILAAAVILTISQNNPVENAKEAKVKSDIKTMQEELIIKVSEELLEEDGDISNLNGAAESQLSGATGYEGKFVIKDGKLQVTDEATAEEKEVANELGITSAAVYVQGVKIPAGFVASQATGENTIAGGLVIYEGDDPVTDANVEDAREERNQFVWVPVEVPTGKTFEEVFARTTTYNGTITDPGDNYEEPYSQNAEEVAEYNAMKQSVEDNGGFYIARYEAGKETINNVETVVSKKGAGVWNDISWGISMINWLGGAVEKAHNMTLANTSDVVRTLIYGVQWDAALQFIAKTDETYPTNSSGKGWYSDNSSNEVKTAGTDIGNTALNKVCNIYDMAGNVCEWTMESLPTGIARVSRGGSYFDSDFDDYSAYGRSAGGTVTHDNTYGFRVALYLK